MRLGLRPGPHAGAAYTALPRRSSRFSGAASRQSKGEEKEREREERKGRGSVPPLLFYNFTTTAHKQLAVLYL